MINEVRRAVLADVSALGQVASAAFEPYVERIGRPPAPMVADYAAHVRDDEVWVVDVAGVGIVGYLVLVERSACLEVESIAVQPSQHGLGIGSALLALAERRAAEQGFGEVRLCTNELMLENLAFYAHRGYEESHRGLQHGYRRVFLRKTLPPR